MIEYRVNSGSLIPFLKTASDFGLCPTSLLSHVGLQTSDVTQRHVRIPVEQSNRLLERCIELTDEPWFGLEAAQKVEMGSYDINGYIYANCSCPLEAINITSQFYGILSDRQVLYSSEDKKYLISRWELSPQIDTVSRNVADHLLACHARYARDILRLPSRFAFASFRHSAPKDSRIMDLYEETFECPLLFDQQHYSIGMDREMARDTLFPQADPALRDILISHAETRLREIRSTPPFTFKVKSLIRKLLEQMVPTREDVAKHLYMGGRTLQRHLLNEGYSFKEVFNEVRQEMAIYYMKDLSLSIDDIAERLGFSETRSFHRSFKQWTGETISSYRRQLMQ
ncbi:AraC family transcriptional regulator [Aestuariicella hydrocarbonica]|uniref:AraC family transcriptional regulator n=1 Tax=Pseudomaricurvus hydrocarbonicus TaxID=1470433 RepID=A0A9E5MN72_9GAMM|nr:AraC family transcriptional regulator [Aestuariicella hydrocarbonica]NHO67319.1 AraC family transcriptional regulator [Aestuariicella hydrocarbonica]